MFYRVCFFSGDFGHLGGETGREIDLPPLLMLTIKSNSQLCWDLDFTHTWNLSNALHEQDSQFFLQEKRVDHDIFGKQMRMECVLFFYFEQVVSFYTQIKSNSSYFVTTFNNSTLNSAN